LFEFNLIRLVGKRYDGDVIYSTVIVDGKEKNDLLELKGYRMICSSNSMLVPLSATFVPIGNVRDY
jgi:hypothetical protein